MVRAEDRDRFLTQVHPTFLMIRLLLSRDPGGAWKEHQATKAEIKFAVTVEATKHMTACRAFAKDHPSIPVAALREALWLDRPQHDAHRCGDAA